MRKVLFFLISILSILTACAQNTNFQSVNNEEFSKVIKKKKIQLVDVRTGQEFVSGHLPKAKNIDMRQADFLEIAKKELKTKYPVAVYCRSGRRSKVAAQKLATQGYEVYELNTGISQWTGKIEK